MFFFKSHTSFTSVTILITSSTRLSRGFHTSFTVVWAGLQTNGLKRRKGTSFTGPPKKALAGGRVGPDSSFTPRRENRDGRSTKNSHVRGSGPQHSSQLNSRTGSEYFQKNVLFRLEVSSGVQVLGNILYNFSVPDLCSV